MKKRKEKGKIIIISGPSGSGKTTLYQELLRNKEIKKGLAKVVSYTTREKRKGEKNGIDYFFISKKMFLYKKRAGHFLESEKVFDNFYGTPKNIVRGCLNLGKNVLLCIDVKGAKEILKRNPKSVSIFVKTPTFEDLKDRLKARASENKKVLELRLKTAKEELKAARSYSYVIVNDKINLALKELTKIIKSKIAA